MFEAIALVVGAVLGVVNTMVGGANQKYMLRQAEYEAAIQFQRDKDLSIYGAYNNQAVTRSIIIVGGIVGLIVMVYLLSKKK